MLLGEILVQRKLLNCQQLEKAIIEQKTHQQQLGETLIKLGLISDNELKGALKEQYWRRNGYWVIGAIDKPLNYDFKNLEKIIA